MESLHVGNRNVYAAFCRNDVCKSCYHPTHRKRGIIHFVSTFLGMFQGKRLSGPMENLRKETDLCVKQKLVNFQALKHPVEHHIFGWGCTLPGPAFIIFFYLGQTGCNTITQQVNKIFVYRVLFGPRNPVCHSPPPPLMWRPCKHPLDIHGFRPDLLLTFVRGLT